MGNKILLAGESKVYDAFEKDEHTVSLFNFNKTRFATNQSDEFIDECGKQWYSVYQGNSSLSFNEKGLTIKCNSNTDRFRLGTFPKTGTSTTLSSLTTSKKFTLEFFINPILVSKAKTTTTAPFLFCLFNNVVFNGTPTSSDYMYSLRVYNEVATFGGNVTFRNLYASDTPNNGTVSPLGGWQHIACCIDKTNSTSNNVTFYGNGIKLPRLGSISGASGSSFTPRIILLGIPTDQNYPSLIPSTFQGTVKGIRISDNIRYTSNFSDKVDLKNLRVID